MKTVYFYELDAPVGLLEWDGEEFVAAPQEMLSILDYPIYLSDASALWAHESPDGFMDGLAAHYKSPYFRASEPQVDTQNRSFFADCERDPRGHCLPGGSNIDREEVKALKGQGFVATAKEHEASVEMAKAKIKSAPVPSEEDVAKAREEIRRAKEEGARPGGESRGGSAASRRQ